jgi:hypothetical protein
MSTRQAHLEALERQQEECLENQENRGQLPYGKPSIMPVEEN